MKTAARLILFAILVFAWLGLDDIGEYIFHPGNPVLSIART